jgi:TRAP-type C4-dicarboxylate transport system permease small subunit|tara:strand:+ start:64 stop:552 length:489 start_codon:yes stop_codon:yes gene_type:complete
VIKLINSFLDEVSKWGIVICLTAMLGLTLMNIILRWFEISFYWSEPLVRHLVFLATFFGASIATGKKQHIKVDLLVRFLEKKDKKRITKGFDAFISLIAMTATLIMFFASLDLVQIEFEFGKLEFLNIHSGYLLSIIPFGFGLLSLRFFIRVLLNLTRPREN